MRSLFMSAALLAVGTGALDAQAKKADADPTRTVAAGKLPAGWQVRIDDKDAKRYSVKDTRFVTMGTGYHVTSGPAALYFKPSMAVQRDTYTVTATLTQTKAPAHPEAYGIFVSGRDLTNSAKQDYAYLLVRGTGEFMLSHRAGQEVHSIIKWTAHRAVNKADASGKQTNTLVARAGTDSVRFVINGTPVAAIPRGHYKNTRGIAGLRVNHNLDVHVSRFDVK